MEVNDEKINGTLSLSFSLSLSLFSTRTHRHTAAAYIPVYVCVCVCALGYREFDLPARVASAACKAMSCPTRLATSTTPMPTCSIIISLLVCSRLTDDHQSDPLLDEQSVCTLFTLLLKMKRPIVAAYTNENTHTHISHQLVRS